MRMCERCGQADAVATVIQLTLDAAKTAAMERHLCSACERQERITMFGPPPESGAGGAERFRPLHAHALRLLARLENTYEVTRSGTFPSSPSALFPASALEELMAVAASPPVLLTPRLRQAAPLAVAFTTPPGLLVRCGRWHDAPFGAPVYSGAGDDPWVTAASETERLDDLVGKVIDGLFAEAVRLPLVGSARVSAAFGDGTPREGLGGEGWGTIPRAHARALIGAGPRAVRWRPWPRRRLWSDADAPAVEPGGPV
jgi:hypothetical protein